MTPPVGPPDAMTPAATTGGLAVPDPGPRPELLEPPEPLAQAAPPGFTEVALPLAPTRTIVPATDQPAGRAVSDPIVPPGTAGSSGRPASVQRSLNVGAAVRPPTEAAALPTLPPIAERPASGVVAADSFLTTISLGAAASGLELGTPVSAVGPADESAPPVARRQPASLPSAQRMETESAPVPATSPSRLSSPGIPYPVTGSVSAPPSGALAVGALAVGLPLVQRSSAVHQSSFTAGEPVASGSARSFDSMFGGASSPSGTATEPRSPLLAVPALQRQSFDDSSASATDVPEAPPATPPVPDGGATSEATDAAVPAASTAAGSAAVPAGAAPTADVDEMARRLYEPLVARLRAELWLDRERSGVFGDG